MSNTEAKNKPIVDLVALRLILKRYWKVLLACLLLGAGLALLFSATAAKKYTANASGVVLVSGSDDLGGAMTGDSIAKSKATQYQSLAKSRKVAADALKIAKVPGDPDSAAAGVVVAVPEDTAQINITVTSGSASDAARLANAWVTALGKNVDELSAEQGLGTQPSASGGSGESGGSSASIISVKPYVQAVVPRSPSSPKTLLNVILGSLLGLLLGALITFFRYRSDGRIRGTETIERDFGVTVMGTLPKRKQDKDRAFLLHTLGRKVSREDFRSIESFNELRANLQFMNPDNPPRAVVISSPLPAEGKSTVAANLALSIAESGRPAVLIDGDLRRPTVADTFGLVAEAGVTTAVVGQASAHDLLQDVRGAKNLKVMTAGPTPPNPSEIVSSAAFAKLVEDLTQDAFVVIDAPPLIPVSDGAVMARRFDGCILVLDAGSATNETLRRALSALDKVDANILGAVVNRVPTDKLESSRYGYYGDYSAYEYVANADVESGAVPVPTSDPNGVAVVSQTSGSGSHAAGDQVTTSGKELTRENSAVVPSRRRRRQS